MSNDVTMPWVDRKGPDAGSPEEVERELRERLAHVERQLRVRDDELAVARRERDEAQRVLGAWTAAHAKWVEVRPARSKR